MPLNKEAEMETFIDFLSDYKKKKKKETFIRSTIDKIFPCRYEQNLLSRGLFLHKYDTSIFKHVHNSD